MGLSGVTSECRMNTPTKCGATIFVHGRNTLSIQASICSVFSGHYELAKNGGEQMQPSREDGRFETDNLLSDWVISDFPVTP